MKRIFYFCVMLLCAIGIQAADYTTYLTAQRGFTEVTSTSQIITDGYYYILTSAEDNGLIVGVGAYEGKPDWANENSKALRYKSAETDPMLDETNFFYIEKNGSLIALRNAIYSADVFQTHNNAGYMYVNTYTCREDNEWEWGCLTPTYDNGYWIFESGKYPISSGDWASGYLGPWNQIVAAGEAMALNRKNTEGDLAGHYRLFRIAKTDFKQAQRERLYTATSNNPVDATWLITNPSFETGDTSGWTYTGDDAEIGAKGSVPSNGDGGYTFNSYQWWTAELSVTQTATNVPDGIYDISATVATWENREVTFSAGSSSVTMTGQGDMIGIPVSLSNINVSYNNPLKISANSIAQWWSSGHEGESQTFFKLDNVRLTCKGLYLGGIAQPLPNNTTTVLSANQWYYYDAPVDGKYTLTGNLLGMVYTEEGETIIPEITTAPTKNTMGFSAGRVYFKTTRSDATLKVEPTMDINTFTACALNVDGLPTTKIITYSLNADGPGSNGTKLISTYLNNKGYDFIGFSEDFNYHSELTSNMNGYTWGTHRGNVSSLSNNTDGLEYATKNSTTSFDNESYIKFNTSEGGVSGGGNTLIKKGYRYYETTIKGVTIDVFITHMDADGGDEDHTDSRNAQWTELANAIKAKNNGRPKIFMGDTNSRWTRENIKTNFKDALSDTYDVHDSWVEMHRDGNYDGLVDESGYGWGIVNQSDPSKYSAYEVVDKIFYLNPKADNTYRLYPTSWKLELDYTDSNGNQLGDHKPVVVDFAIAYNEAVDNTVTPGDIVAHDGANTTDLEALVNILMGNTQDSYDLNAADVNRDGEITLSDITALVNLIKGN